MNLTIKYNCNAPIEKKKYYTQTSFKPLPHSCLNNSLILQSPVKIISSFHPKQRGKNLHYFADSCGSVCCSTKLSYWVYQRSRVRIFLEITEGEMSQEVIWILHQRELETGHLALDWRRCSCSLVSPPYTLQHSNFQIPSPQLPHTLNTRTLQEITCGFHLPCHPYPSELPLYKGWKNADGAYKQIKKENHKIIQH